MQRQFAYQMKNTETSVSMQSLADMENIGVQPALWGLEDPPNTDTVL